jgi:DNA damage-inducible protein 1
MLKAHQACIDLQKNVLRIQDREVVFLPEHELPERARMEHMPDELAPPGGNPGGNPGPSGSQSQPRTQFPGSGNTLGSAPAQGVPASRYPEKDIQMIMDLGVSREAAIQTLDAAGGNVDVAASLLF